MGSCDFVQDRLDPPGVSPAGHAHLDDHAAYSAALGVVGDDSADEVRVGNDQVRAVEGLDPGRTDRDVAHIA